MPHSCPPAPPDAPERSLAAALGRLARKATDPAVRRWLRQLAADPEAAELPPPPENQRRE